MHFRFKYSLQEENWFDHQLCGYKINWVARCFLGKYMTIYSASQFPSDLIYIWQMLNIQHYNFSVQVYWNVTPGGLNLHSFNSYSSIAFFKFGVSTQWAVNSDNSFACLFHHYYSQEMVENNQCWHRLLLSLKPEMNSEWTNVQQKIKLNASMSVIVNKSL